jgi:V/A-type H+-transporting ATPase subunit C
LGRTKDLDYLYAVTQVRVLEKTFLSRQTLSKMLEQKHVKDIIKLLTEAGFGYPGKDYQADAAYEQLLLDEYNKTFQAIYELAPQKEIFDLFLLKNDYHNMKLIIKSELLLEARPDLKLESGTIPFEQMESSIRKRDFLGLSKYMERAVLDSLAQYAKTKDPQEIDLICDSMEYQETAERVQGIENPFLREYFAVRADFSNFRSFLRIRKSQQGPAFLEKVLVDGGVVSKELFLENVRAPWDAVLAAFSTTHYSDVWKKAIVFYKEKGRFGGVEKLLDDAVISFISKARQISFGPEALIAFLVARESEIKNARIILGGVAVGANPDILRERIRESYV